MIAFALGLIAGAIAGAAGLYFIVLRNRLIEAQDWIQVYEYQERVARIAPPVNDVAVRLRNLLRVLGGW